VDVRDEDEEPGELLAALRDAELARLLDRVDGVAAALASPITLAFEACAWSRKDEKSVPGNGVFTAPKTLPPFFCTIAVVSRSSAWPKA
jgi:hypothetical protein